jgi:hypothetical protein
MSLGSGEISIVAAKYAIPEKSWEMLANIRSVGPNLLKRVKGSCAGRPSLGHPTVTCRATVRHRRLSIVDFIQGDCYISYHPFASYLFQILLGLTSVLPKVGSIYCTLVFFTTVLLLASHISAVPGVHIS